MMDRSVRLADTAQSGYDQSKALIEKWHRKGRLLYAITPRWAGSSTPAQLEAAGALWREYPDLTLQTHIAENRDEVAFVTSLFPERKGLPRHLRSLRPRAAAHGARPLRLVLRVRVRPRA
jgi:guanine deaminase